MNSTDDFQCYFCKMAIYCMLSRKFEKKVSMLHVKSRTEINFANPSGKAQTKDWLFHNRVHLVHHFRRVQFRKKHVLHNYACFGVLLACNIDIAIFNTSHFGIYPHESSI